MSDKSGEVTENELHHMLLGPVNPMDCSDPGDVACGPLRYSGKRGGQVHRIANEEFLPNGTVR
jgi:hypothetical protein